jgi:type VI secretion system protein ImpC
MADRVNETIQLAMGMLLHDPDFQALESARRSVDFVLRRLGTTADLQVHLIDVSKQELLDDLTAVTDPRSTGIYRLLVEPAAATSEENAWAVVAGLYTFEPEPGEIRALGAMRVSRRRLALRSFRR